MSDVFDGQIRQGSIEPINGGFSAFGLDGKNLGNFQTRTAALVVILNTARGKEAARPRVFQLRTEAQSAVLLAQRENKSGGMPIDEVKSSTVGP